VTPTEQFINVLANLKTGELGLLRTHGGKGLDESTDGFDLFAGLWWPLRQKNQRAPRREVAWLVAKLFAHCPIQHSHGDLLAKQLRKCSPYKEPERERFMEKFDRMLIMPVDKIETHIQWALALICSNNLKVDWVKLTDDLSLWEREATRQGWAEQLLKIEERGQSC